MTDFETTAAHFKGKRVLVTGHTGFKGGWLSLWLDRMGAQVCGLALPSTSRLSLFDAVGLEKRLAHNAYLDLRDRPRVLQLFREFEPEIVFHLAAQALVGVSVKEPAETFETNVLGTVNVLEGVRATPAVDAAILITSDKCYENVEQIWGYRETDRLGGTDPYSASKAAAEAAIRAYTKTFFTKGRPKVASTRAGNVIGGGDWSEYRLVPDCMRSLRAEEPIVLRQPQATRPWQYVLEPLWGYLVLAAAAGAKRPDIVGAWNFGPPVENANTVAAAVAEIVGRWGGGSVRHAEQRSFHEHLLLQLDSAKARQHLGWEARLSFRESLRWTTDWYIQQHQGGDGDMHAFSIRQIEEYEARLAGDADAPL